MFPKPMIILPALLLLAGLAMAYKHEKECSCPEKWVKHKKHCYREIKDKKVSHKEAEDNCKSMGGHLANVFSESDDFFSRGHHTKNKPKPVASTTVECTHSGMRVEKDASGKCTKCYHTDGSNCSHGDPTKVGFTKGKFPWGKGSDWGGSEDEPKSAPGALCMSWCTNTLSPGNWALVQCEGPSAMLGTYICKYSPNPNDTQPPEPNAVCETGYSMHRGKCHKMVTTQKDFNSAQQDCQLNGGNLPTIETESDLCFHWGLSSKYVPSPAPVSTFVRILIGLVALRVQTVIKAVNWVSGEKCEYADITQSGFWFGDKDFCSGSEMTGGVAQPRADQNFDCFYMAKNEMTPGCWAAGPRTVTGIYAISKPATCPEGTEDMDEEGFCFDIGSFTNSTLSTTNGTTPSTESSSTGSTPSSSTSG